MRYLQLGWLVLVLLACGPRVGPAHASFHHQITFQYLPAAGSSEQPAKAGPGGGEAVVLDALPAGFREQSTTTTRGGRIVDRPMVGVAEGFPSAEDPHRYLGRLRVAMTVSYEGFRPDDEELSAERQALVRERDRLALEHAATAGGNAVVLRSDTMNDGKEDGWWWRGALRSRGYKCDEGGNCAKHWAEYHVLYVSKADRRIMDSKTALASLAPQGYQPIIQGQALSDKIVLPLQRNHCYALGIAFDEAAGNSAGGPITIRFQGLKVDRWFISTLKQSHTLKLDSMFARAAVTELACSPISEKQPVQLAVRPAAAKGLSWSLFARRMKPDEAVKEYCYQCSGDAHACGRHHHKTCRPLADCLQRRQVSLAQCQQHFPAAY